MPSAEPSTPARNTDAVAAAVSATTPSPGAQSIASSPVAGARETMAPPLDPAATLPGTNVSVGSWAQFHRRMRLRRETTCLTAMRRAMDADDYGTALQRAIELVDIDPVWNETRLVLEQLQAETGAAGRPRRDSRSRPSERATDRPIARPGVLLLQAPPATHAERPRRRRRFRTAAFAALATLIVGALAGWTMVRVLPPEVTDRWIGPLVNGWRAAESTAPPVQSPPSPPSPELDAPDLPFAGISPPPALPGEVAIGNTVSQNRQEAGPDAAQELRTPSSTRPGASKLAALPALPLRPDAGVQDGGVDAGSVRFPADAGRTESAMPPGADNPVAPDTRGLQPAPLTIVAPLAASPPATPASAPPRSDPSAPPGASESTGQPPSDERAPTTGIGPPPDLRATTAAEEREADQRAITRTIGAYAQGYTSLNASAVRHVWPGVNEDALRNAFEQIESQAVAFSGCHVDVRGLHASATCRGTATYVPKVGSRDRVTASREWRFSLRKVVNMWVIETVDISE